MAERAEAIALLSGMLLLCLAALLVDVRLGLGLAGVFLILSALDVRGLRR